VVEGPGDDDPTESPKLLVQLKLEAVSGLGGQLGPAKVDDEAADRDDQGISRTAKGNNEVAKGVAQSRRQPVA
jgi:hypothetical protein